MSEYSSMAHRLQLVPATGKRAEGFNFETRLDRNATTSGSMISLDFKGIVKPTLQRIQEQYNAKARCVLFESEGGYRGMGVDGELSSARGG